MIPSKFSGAKRVCVTVVGIVFIVLFFSLADVLIQKISNPEFTVQDVWVYCCDHPEVEITGYGDNCTWVIDYVYNGECYNDDKSIEDLEWGTYESIYVNYSKLNSTDLEWGIFPHLWNYSNGTLQETDIVLYEEQIIWNLS